MNCETGRGPAEVARTVAWGWPSVNCETGRGAAELALARAEDDAGRALDGAAAEVARTVAWG